MGADSDHWNEIDTMAALDKTKKVFEGQHLEPAARNAARNSSTFDPLSGRKAIPVNFPRETR